MCTASERERQKKKSKSTPDHKRPKINGLLRRLWDGDARVSSREREEGKTTTAPHCPSCSFTFSSFEFDPTLFCGSSLGPLASSRKKVGKRGSREVVAAAPTLWASTLKTCRELFDQVQKTRWQIEGLGALREDSLVRTRQTFYVTFLSEFVMWKLQCVAINLLLAEEKKVILFTELPEKLHCATESLGVDATRAGLDVTLKCIAADAKRLRWQSADAAEVQQPTLYFVVSTAPLNWPMRAVFVFKLVSFN